MRSKIGSPASSSTTRGGGATSPATSEADTEAEGPGWSRPAVNPETARPEASEDTSEVPEHAISGGV
jgi:hypothetical protein